MTNLFKKAALAATVAGFAFASPALAASATQVSQTGSATVKIYTPLVLKAVANDSTIDFGILVAGAPDRASPATFVMATDGSDAVTCGGGGWLCSGTTKAANFTVAGTDQASVNIGIDPLVTLTDPVSLSTVSIATATDLTTPNNVVLGTTATPFLVAGTLSVPANTPDGVYTGSFNVTADYN